MFPTIETSRLRLREIIDIDEEPLFRIFSNSSVTQYYGQEPLDTIEQAKGMIEYFHKLFQEKSGIRWGIETIDDNRLIGTIGYHLWSPKHRRANIGYELHPEFWRKGYTQEALLHVIPYGFEHMQLNRIGAVVFVENDSSNQLLKKMGFQQDGILKEYMFQSGKFHDTNVYSLLKNKQY